MSFRKWEGSLPEETIVRVRVFNESGDLDIRRHGDRYHWRYVGTQKPKGEGKEWTQPEGTHLFVEEKSFYLWGWKERGKRRFESQVARANLEYPIDPENAFVKLKCRVYSVDGTISFVQYMGLEAVEGGRD